VLTDAIASHYDLAVFDELLAVEKAERAALVAEVERNLGAR
jgi:hypothetical protein